MNNRRIAITAAVLSLAVAAYASPIFGTWKGELNGHSITITVTSQDGHGQATMSADGQNVAVSNAAFPKGQPPLTLHFQAANHEGKMKLVSTAATDLSFELTTSDGHESTLRVFDQGREVATARMTKVEAAK